MSNVIGSLDSWSVDDLERSCLHVLFIWTRLVLKSFCVDVLCILPLPRSRILCGDSDCILFQDFQLMICYLGLSPSDQRVLSLLRALFRCVSAPFIFGVFCREPKIFLAISLVILNIFGTDDFIFNRRFKIIIGIFLFNCILPLSFRTHLYGASGSCMSYVIRMQVRVETECLIVTCRHFIGLFGPLWTSRFIILTLRIKMIIFHDLSCLQLISIN